MNLLWYTSSKSARACQQLHIHSSADLYQESFDVYALKNLYLPVFSRHIIIRVRLRHTTRI